MKITSEAAVAMSVLMVLVLAAWFFGREPAHETGREPAVAAVKNREEISTVREEVAVTKVIDGDTIVVAGGDHVRLLGIDADEKDYPCYEAARLRLEELVLRKTVSLERDSQDLDQYGRKLRYVFAEGENVDEKLVAEGLAVARFYPENQKYKAEIAAAEAKAMESKTGCKWGGQPQTAKTADHGASAGGNYKWQKISGAAIDPCTAKNYTGKEVIVEGVAVDVYRSGSNTVFLNFGAAYPDNCFTAVIFGSNLSNFSDNPESNYKNRMVRVRGLVNGYGGKPEIILNDSSQIEVREQ